MNPFVKRNLLIPAAFILFAGVLYGLIFLVPALKNSIQHLELIIISLLIMLSVAVMLFWVTMGAFGGLASFLLAMILIYRPLIALNPYYYNVLILAFILNSFYGNHFFRAMNKENQDHAVAMEKVREDTNLIQNHFEARTAEISAMENKVDSLLKLKSIADDLSLSFSTEEVVKVTSEKTFDKFQGDIRVSFFLVDEKTKELSIYNTVKTDKRKPVVMKKGGIFERWVIKNVQGLLIKDATKDYRFSMSGDETADDFISLISKPLVSEGNVIGVLRVDSPLEEAFTQHELRVLDIIGELAAVALKNAKLYKTTEELAIRDGLTGLYVHRYFMEYFEEEVKRGLHSGGTFAVIMLDIDDFKKFNDMYGHIAGDLMLKKVSRILESKASAGDIVCRYGGEEFAFISLNKTKKQAMRLAEEIKEEIEKSPISIRREMRGITVSVGISMFPEDAKLREDLLWEADRCLYKAKAEGKNRVCSK